MAHAKVPHAEKATFGTEGGKRPYSEASLEAWACRGLGSPKAWRREAGREDEGHWDLRSRQAYVKSVTREKVGFVLLSPYIFTV